MKPVIHCNPTREAQASVESQRATAHADAQPMLPSCRYQDMLDYEKLDVYRAAGKPTDKDRSRFHAIARGSAMECEAILDIMQLQAVTEPKTLIEAKSLLVRLVAMLSKMCR